jgi:phosphatidylinositol-3-phosphatase
VSLSADGRARCAPFLGIAGTAVLMVSLALGVQHNVLAGSEADGATAPALATGLPSVRHVFVVNIENKGFRTTWGAHSAAPYLAKTLRAKGRLLKQYYGTAHHSLGNYVAQVSGQGPDSATQNDCSVYSRFKETRPRVRPGQVVGDGCVYPKKVRTLPGQLMAAGLSWRAYMQDMARPCQHSRLGSRERWTSATKRQQYATRHNPFMYFRSITSRPAYCQAHVKPLAALARDLNRRSRTRTLSYITPDLCHDAHDGRCADGGWGGLRATNLWLKRWIPKILASPAFRANGMLVITADESEGVREDSRACCGEGPGPNARRPGIEGPGGGRVGALVISPFVRPGTVSRTPYNHYGLLGSIEDLLGLKRLGYAKTVTGTFGRDVYGAG